MPDEKPEVKRLSRRVADWVDSHPRTGWYLAIWAGLVSVNALIGWVDAILHLLS